ncbi:MAG TPA: hypothetical protein VLH58_01180 [Candidatus Methylomirabilis sp.]|nr:hypothetical protein [Candidatus Methylomirabilis sp.]
MPRHPHLDAPNTLHHVMVRGRERRVILRDDPDRADCVTCVSGLAEAEALGGTGLWLALVLAVTPQSVYRAAVRGAARAAEWARLITR